MKKGRERPKIIWVQVIKSDVSIKKVTKYDFIQNRMEKKNTCGQP